MFIYFDGLSGIMSPLMSCLKSQLIPEKFRTTVMNFFRLPINLFSIITLVLTNVINTNQICLIAVIMMGFAGLFNLILLSYKISPEKDVSLTEKNSSSNVLNKIRGISY